MHLHLIEEGMPTARQITIIEPETLSALARGIYQECDDGQHNDLMTPRCLGQHGLLCQP
jgi:hypothetical protein